MKDILKIAFVGCLAGAGWLSGYSPLLASSILTALVWNMADSKKQLGVGILLYYLTLSSGIPAAGSTFFDNPAKAITIWIGASIALTIPWVILFNAENKSSLKRLGLLFITLFIPPYTFISIGHPIFASAVLFKGLGILSLALAFILFVMLAQWTKYTIPLILLLIGAAISQFTPDNQTNTIEGVNTKWGSGYNKPKEFYNNFANLKDQIKNPNAIVLLPEAAGGQLDEGTAFLFNELPKREALIPVIEKQNGVQFNSVLSKNTGNIYRARVIVPFRNTDAKQERGVLFGPSYIVSEQGKIGVLVCYEVMIPWSAITSALVSKQVVVPINNWFATESNTILGIQKMHAEMLSRVFNIEVKMAINTSPN